MGREVVILTPEQVEVKFELAGIGSRFIALLIDILWQALAYVVLFLVFLGLGVSGAFNILGSANGWVVAALILVVFCINSGYFLFFEATRNGQTPGKKSAGIRVVRDTGHPVDFRSALVRNAMRLADCQPGTIYAIGIVSIFFSPQYRRLGDYVAGTLVVKVGLKPEQMPRQRPTITGQTAPPVSTGPVSILPQEVMSLIGQITKDDYRAMRHFLDRRLELDMNVSRELATKLAGQIAQKLQMESSDVVDPVAFLTAVSSEWERRVIH